MTRTAELQLQNILERSKTIVSPVALYPHQKMFARPFLGGIG